MTNERKITRRTALKGLALTAGALAVPKIAEDRYQPSLEESLGRLPEAKGRYDKREAFELAEIKIHPRKDNEWGFTPWFSDFDLDKEYTLTGYVSGLETDEDGEMTIEISPEVINENGKMILNRSAFTHREWDKYGPNISVKQIIDYKTIRKL
ncbi:twin-arginine translocation signal domain-containing protein [Candidatus Pacearchaeota archaeon]|nr:twin-arginine translocation signal domain-containing protein [Candidatus Pacearchaeota archaeon]